MIITNPFTRQVLNINPEGCNQYSGPECSGHSQIRSLKDSIGALGKEAEDSARILQHFDSPLDSPLLFQHAGEKARIAGVVRDYRIHTLGPYPREVAAHEFGHG